LHELALPRGNANFFCPCCNKPRTLSHWELPPFLDTLPKIYSPRPMNDEKVSFHERFVVAVVALVMVAIFIKVLFY
jgi:hypothetical protein